MTQYQGKPPRPLGQDEQHLFEDPYVLPVTGMLPLAVPWQQQNDGQITQLIPEQIQYTQCQPSLKIPWPALFPISVLPSQLVETVRCIQQETQASECLIGASMLSVMSFCVQDNADVSPNEQLCFPLTLYQIALAGSGERKSTIDRLLMRPMREEEAKWERKYKEELEQYDNKIYIWRIKKKALEKDYERKVLKGKETEADIQQLEECLAREPIKPVRKRMLLNDVTNAAFKKELGLGWPSLMLHSDEAGSILKSDLLVDTPLLNSTWSGDPREVDRASSKGYRIDDVRVSIMLMLQPGLFRDFVARNKGQCARTSGFLARTLICQPRSTIGTRFNHGLGQQQTVSSSALVWFYSRAKALLELAFQRRENQGERTCLTLSTEASAMWHSEYNRIEMMSGPESELKEFQDYASKHAEQVARIAGVIEAFVTGKTVISGETMNASIQIAGYYFGSFIELMSDSSIQGEMKDAKLLEEWLVNNVKILNGSPVAMEKNFILKYGPNSLRKIERLNHTLNNLMLSGKVCLFKHQRKSYVCLLSQPKHPSQINYGF